MESYTLTHSELGQLLAQGGTGQMAESSAFSYDVRGRLAAESEQVTPQGGSTINSTGSYRFDLANNLFGGSGWVYNASNQVTSAPAQSGMAGATGLAYDAAGNLTAANGLTLGWDCWGRLTSVAGTPQGTVTFAYDFAGRRVAKTVAGVTTYFLYDGDMLLAELDSAGSVLKSYTWGATGLISERAAGQSRFHLYDSSGNTRLLVTASGTVLSRSAYNAWGALLAGLAPATPLGYSGRFGGYTDAETGLILLGARYYAPAIGRFLSRDPIGFDGGINLYNYCAGDPANFSDPEGNRPENNLDRYVFGLLFQEFAKAVRVNDKVMEASLIKARNEIRTLIASVPVGTQDPPSLRAIEFALSNLGNTNYGYNGTVCNGVTEAIGPQQWKCNLFVANSYGIGAGLGFDGASGVPTNTTRRGHRYPNAANTLADATQKVPHFPVVAAASKQIGDLVAFHNPRGLGHSGLYAGGGLMVYAGTSAVEVRAVTFFLPGHDQISYRRYKP